MGISSTGAGYRQRHKVPICRADITGRRFRSWTSLALLSVLCSLSNSCTRDFTPQRRDARLPTANDPQALWQDEGGKLRWMQRLSRTLRFGKELSVKERRFLTASPDDYIEHLFSDRDFASTILDFNLYILGFRSATLKFPDGSPESYVFGAEDLITSFPLAIVSALGTARDGDHSILFGIESDQAYLQPNISGVFKFQEVSLDFDAMNAESWRRMRQALEAMGNAVRGPGTAQDYCKSYAMFNDSAQIAATPFVSLWLTSLAVGLYPLCQEILLQESVVTQANEGEPAAAEDIQPIPSLPLPLTPAMEAHFRRFAAEFRRFERLYDSLQPERYLPRSISELRAAEAGDLPADSIYAPFLKQGTGDWFWSKMTNSSTNFNRKRAAYILKRFFCDDLTPINLAVPENHVGGKHASDPACYSCHYKLDPMAGFFRHHGAEGQNFGGPGTPAIFFDDGASALVKDYDANWMGGDGRAEIGYIRSVTDPGRNSYPKDRENPGLDDLFGIIRDAPEAKRCLVQRAFEYMVGTEVALDRGYLAELTVAYEKKSKAQSTGAALKTVLQKIAISRSFSVETTERGVCYDFAAIAGADAGLTSSRPPCQVAEILRKNCESCHGSSLAQGGLNLELWGAGDNGERGFQHTDSDGQPIPYSETLARMEKRLTESDPELRMPLNQFMDAQDTEILFKWVRAEAENQR